MECPMCDGETIGLLVNDDHLCEDCGHRWTPDEALGIREPVAVTETLEAA